MNKYNTERAVAPGKPRDIEPASGWVRRQMLCKRMRRVALWRRHGVTMIWVAIYLLLMILIVGLSLDSAKGYLIAHQLQNAADAAALAGAQIVKIDPNQARLKAIEVAMLNFADKSAVQIADNPQNLPDGDVVIGRYDRDVGIFIPTFDKANAVKIVARRLETSLGGPVSLNFGPAAGVETVNIERYAIAMTSGTTGAGLICLRPDGVGLLVNGTVDLAVIDINNDNIDEGIIHVNSKDDNGVSLIGTPDIICDGLDVCGDVDPTGGIDLDALPFPIDNHASYRSDPLCLAPPGTCLSAPSSGSLGDLGGASAVTITGGTHVFSPGYYSEGFRISGGDVTFKPGIYIIGGSSQGQKSGLVVSGNTNLCAKGVMFYITGDGVVDLGGTGQLRITPLEVGNTDFCYPAFKYPKFFSWAEYQGISIFQGRENTNDARIRGTSLMDLDGTLYFPTGHVDLTGTGDGFGNQLIAWSAEVSGTGNILIEYDGRNKSSEYKSYLVE